MGSRRKVGFIAGAGLGAAAAVALRRRWSGDEDAAPNEPTPPEVGAPGEAGASFLAHLAEAIRIETVSYEDSSRVDFGAFERFRAFLADTYPLAHETLTLELVAGHSLLYTWTGSDPDAAPTVLMAHQDVVPVEPGTEDDWEQPPFSGAEDAFHLYGRGSLDDKGSLIGIFEAVESMLADGFEPTATIYLACGHDEEVGGDGAAAIAELLAERGVRASLVVDEGGGVAVDFMPDIDVPIALIGIGEKGYVNVRLTATGQGGHSSSPPAHTAIGLLSAAITALEDNPMPPRFDAQRGFFETAGELMTGPQAMALKRPDLFGAVIERRMSAQPMMNAIIRTTTAVTMIDGGVKPNVLPQEATALVNFRIMPGDSVEAVLEHVGSAVGPGIEVSIDESSFSADPPQMADPESEQFALVAELAGEHCGAGAAAPWILTGATDSRHFIPIADQVLRFAPLTATPDDFKRFHGTGERIRRSDADAVVAFYRALIGRVGGRS
jgi:carboxypeptidase PM20D1